MTTPLLTAHVMLTADGNRLLSPITPTKSLKMSAQLPKSNSSPSRRRTRFFTMNRSASSMIATAWARSTALESPAWELALT